MLQTSDHRADYSGRLRVQTIVHDEAVNNGYRACGRGRIPGFRRDDTRYLGLYGPAEKGGELSLLKTSAECVIRSEISRLSIEWRAYESSLLHNQHPPVEFDDWMYTAGQTSAEHSTGRKAKWSSANTSAIVSFRDGAWNTR